MTDEGVCRTAPATPGLLIITKLFVEQPLALPASAKKGFHDIYVTVLETVSQTVIPS